MSCYLNVFCTSNLKSITAEYTGPLEAETIIETGNANVKVIATYEDNTTEEITDWILIAPVTLEVDKTTDLIIKYKDKECILTITCSTISDAKYKTLCESISYTELARNPKTYEGRNVSFIGTVLQVMEDKYDGKNYVDLRIATKLGYSKYTDDVVYVTYAMDEDAPRFLEDDTVTFYGVSDGLYTYKTVMGASLTIPKVIARIIELK